jgi:hypothetical protein
MIAFGHSSAWDKKTRFFKNEPEKLLITKDRPSKTNRNEPKNEAEKLLKTGSCGKNEPKNEPGHVVENAGSSIFMPRVPKRIIPSPGQARIPLNPIREALPLKAIRCRMNPARTREHKNPGAVAGWAARCYSSLSFPDSG